MRVLLFALAATCSAVSLTAQQRAISDSDLFAFRWVASPQISPDGRQVAYVLVTVNAKHDGYETSLWIVGTDGASSPRRLTAGPRDGAPRWSRDGKTLAFVRPKDSHPQLDVPSLPGGGGAPGHHGNVRRERAAVESRRGAHLLRLGSGRGVVLLSTRQQLLFRAGGGRRPRHGGEHRWSDFRSRPLARRQGRRVPRLD